MTSRISFNIDSMDVISESEDSHFAVAKVRAFSSGPNLHNMECSEELLEKTASTIYNKPVLYNINKMFDDFGSHTTPEQSLIAGFAVPDSASFKRDEKDGRLTFEVLIRLWKRYVPDVMKILKRDAAKKISVEMDLIDSEERPDGIIEMKDFAYAGICLLGDMVREASPGANMEVLCFSKEKNEYEIVKQDFSKYDSFDMTIPKKVKSNAQKGLDLCKEYGFGNSVSLSVARHFVKSEKSTPEKIRHTAKTFKGKKFNDMVKDPPSQEYVTYMLYGGKDSMEWSMKLADEMDSKDKEHLSYFNFEGDKSFEKEEMSMEDEKEVEEPKKEEMAAAETPEEGKKEDPKEEAKETPEEEGAEQKDEKMSLDANLDVAAALAFLKSETEDYTKLVAEFSDEGTKNYAKLAYAMYGKMMAMKDECEKMSAEKEEMCGKFAAEEEKNRAYMAENEELKKFKADFEARQFESEVAYTLKTIEESVAVPKEEMAALFEESKKFSLETIDAFKNLAKARAFNFAVKGKKAEGDAVRYALPFTNVETKKSNSPWIR